MRLLVHFARYGPYHHARLREANVVLAPLGWEVIGLETAGTDATYAWDETKGASNSPKVITAFPGRVHEEITSKECRKVMHPLLDSLDPDAIAIAGWASPDALSCLSWCRKHDGRRIVMSETREADGKRVWWKELIKRYLISRFDGALVGGKSHRDYLVKLGMSADKIRFGYNVVDNEYFRKGRDAFTHASDLSPPACDTNVSACGGPATRDEVGRMRKSVPTPFFLASNRFIERKNLSRLIEAYAIYGRDRFTHRSEEPGCAGPAAPDQVGNMRKDDPAHAIWPLCLLGGGELKPALIAQCRELGLAVIESAPWNPPTTDNRQPTTLPLPTVFFPGFRQIDELPRFYAHAGCFVHPALEEPWGLVINEAMACGLPVLSSGNVGAAEELVDDGVNGWKFDPLNVGEMARYMITISALDFPISAFGDSSRRILEERCPTSAFGRGLARLLNR